MSTVAIRLDRIRDELIPALGLDPVAINLALETFVENVSDYWKGRASLRLRSTLDDYQRSVHGFMVGPLRGMVAMSAEPKLAVMLEIGHEPFDMRKGLLVAGRRGVHLSAENHLYRSIPFRHYTPPKPGELRVGGRVMGSEDDTGELTKAIHEQAKKLWYYRKGAPASARKRMRLAEGTGGAEKLKPWHTTDIYTSMIKKRRSPSSAEKGSQYTTFRTISNNPETRRFHEGAEVGWMHPGFKALNLVEQAADYAVQAWPAVIAAAMGFTE